jgi:ubiquinol-cytochrome c reductase cytochrome b subunit
MILLHTLLVVLTAGYRKPKEFTFWSGLVLGGLTLALAISGNPLPWDQKGYWAYQIETGIAGTMPVIGSALRSLLVGGAEFGNLTLTRLYRLHVVVLPVLAVFFLVIHIVLMRREKLLTARSLIAVLPIVKATDEISPGACVTNETEPYWPYQTTRNLLMFGVLMVLVVLQVTVYPQLKERYAKPASTEWEQDVPLGEITLEAPADRNIPYVARPEWYVRFLFELRHMVPKEKEVLITGVLPIVILVLLFLMPFYEKVLGRYLGYGFSVVLFVSGLAVMIYLTYDGIHHDRNDADYQASRRREIDYAGRATWLARQNGIPPEGPVTLLHNDAKAMGPLLFADNCANCHSWNGHDGTGNVVMETKGGKNVPIVPTASDLYRFGSTDWIAGFLANPGDEKYFGHMGRLKGGDEFIEGEMVDWAGSYVAPEGPLTEKLLQAVAALVAKEAGRSDETPASEDVLKLGVAIFSGGKLKDSQGKILEFDGRCLDCHNMKAGDPDSEGDGYAPDLNGYASKKWLTDFIRDPAGEKFYPDKNIMPAFDRTQISERDLGLLADWIRGEWARSEDSRAVDGK